MQRARSMRRGLCGFLGWRRGGRCGGPFKGRLVDEDGELGREGRRTMFCRFQSFGMVVEKVFVLES